MAQILYTTQFGSRLFGTATPASDLDIKHIELPDIQSLLIGKKIGNRVVKTNAVENTKNTSEDIDVEFVPLQTFARHFFEGQTYALEIAFSIAGTHAGQTHYGHDGTQAPIDPQSDFCQFVGELTRKFLTSNIKAMMGYVVNQASLYSFKGERLNCAKAVNAFILSIAADQSLEDSMANQQNLDAATRLTENFPKYFQIAQYEYIQDKYAPCFKLLEKTIPWSIQGSSAGVIVASSIKKYGQRAKDASADNVDWKATMHAVRIVDEGIQLLSTNRIDLPHPPEKAQRLLAIRRGEAPLDDIQAELDAKLDLLKNLSNSTALPPITPEFSIEFDNWLQNWMMRFYKLNKEPSVEQSAKHKI